MELSSRSAPASSESSVKTLFERRVPQIIGIYIGAVWTFFGIVQWLVNRYVLSPHLEELVLLTALLFLPSVIMLAYGHGAPGRNIWRSYEKIGLTCNVLIAISVLFFVFSDKDLGSAQKTVQVVDVDGNEVERTVPKDAFRKRLALFFFDNKSGDESLNWLREGIPMAWDVDIDQDLFLTSQSIALFADKLQKAGYNDGLSVPMALKRSLTSEFNLDYFLSGTLNKEGDDLSVTTTLHDAQTGKLVKTHTYTGTDVFEIIDEMTIELKEDLELPSKHIEETTDLPASEVLTPSIKALESYRNGLLEMLLERDFPKAINSFETATTEDPSFAMAHVQKYALLLQQGQMQPALQALNAAQQHNYRLTEQVKYLLKVGQLNLGGNHEQALEAANQWRTLYPDDLQAHQIVGLLYVIRNRFEEAIDAYKQLLAIDPTQHAAALEIARLLKETGKTEEAIARYQAYNEQYPDRNDGYNQLAQIYFDQGDLEKELETRKVALSINPNDPGAHRRIGEVQKRMGNFEEALAQLQTALELSKTPQEKTSSHEGMGSYYWLLGRHKEAIAEYEAGLEIGKASLPAVWQMVYLSDKTTSYYEAGYKDRMQAFLGEALNNPITRQFPDLMLYITSGASWIYAKEGRIEEGLALLDETEALIEQTNFLLLKPMLTLSKGKALIAAGRFDEALPYLEAYLEAKPTSTAGWNRKGETLHELGDYDAAIESFNKALQFYPSSPLSMLGLGKAWLAKDNPQEAASYLDKALAVWENSDETNANAREAKTLRSGI